jgi:multiple antibiotic resistance protein
MTLYTATITLMLVMDPLGNIPIFLTILKNFDFKTQRKIIIREAIVAFIVLCAFLFFGQYIMRGLNITTTALSIAGSIILFLIAIRMIFPQEESESKDQDAEEPFIVPLAVPLTAGPSAIAIVMLFVTREPQQQGMLFLAVTIASAVFLVVMLLARYLMRLLGKRGLIALERLMGMILTTIAVQMFLSGIMAYFHK